MTDGRLREATTVEISTALGKLFRALPPRRATPEELSEAYLIACHKCTKHAIETVVVKLIRGEIPDVSKSFAPGPAELSTALRHEMDFVLKQIELAENRLKIEDDRPVGVKPFLLEDRVATARQQMSDEGRHVLFVVSSHAAMMARRRNMPTGSIYVSILGAAYGPPGYIPPAETESPAPAASEPEPEADNIPW